MAPGLFGGLGLDSLAVSPGDSVPGVGAGDGSASASLSTVWRDTGLVGMSTYDGPERRRKPRPKNGTTLLEDILHSLERRFSAVKNRDAESGAEGEHR